MSSVIDQVKKHIDDMIWSGSDAGSLFNLDDYQLRSRSPKNSKSRYALITDILNYDCEGKKLIDEVDEANVENLYDECLLHMANHPTRDFPGGGPLGQ